MRASSPGTKYDMSSAIGMGRIDLGALILITGAFSVPNTRPAAVAEQTGRLTWIFFVMFDERVRPASGALSRS